MKAKRLGKRIVIVGKVGMDMIAIVDSFPGPGQAAVASEMRFVPGGKAGNQAAAASSLGGRVTFVSRVGSDDFGKRLKSHLRSKGIDVSMVRSTGEMPTGKAMVIVNKDSENIVVSFPGSTRTLSESDLDGIKFAKGEIAVTQLGVPHGVVRELFRKAKSAGAVTLLNAAPRVKCDEEILELADFIILNESEAAFFAGEQSISDDPKVAERYARMIAKRPGQAVVATLGERGCVAVRGKETVRIDGIKVRAVDTSGAGDTFIGALAAALSEGAGLSKALGFANKAASVAVQRRRTESSMPTREEVGPP